MRLIDADEVIKAVNDLMMVDKTVMGFVLMNAPTVDAVPVVHGRWNCSDDAYENAVCSVCGWDTVEPWVHIKEWFEFCPHCGAKMDGNGDGNG